jgi:hypothetical protein
MLFSTNIPSSVTALTSESQILRILSAMNTSFPNVPTPSYFVFPATGGKAYLVP